MEMQQNRGPPVVRDLESLLETHDLVAYRIFGFVGCGEFLFLASVSHQFKKSYTSYCKKSDTRPSLVLRGHFCFSYSYDHTFYSAAFCNVSRAQFWESIQPTVPYGEATIELIAKHGTAEVLQWASETEGYPWTENTFVGAAGQGHVEQMEWALRNLSFPLDWDLAKEAAAKAGQVDVLKWIHRNHGFSNWMVETRYDYHSLGNIAATWGHKAVLEWALGNGHELSNDIAKGAIERGRTEILEWLIERGDDSLDRTSWCSDAAFEGNLELLQWCREHDCPWDRMTCSVAAGRGHLEVLQWAHEQGCPWDKWTCIDAAGRGHLEVLQWAHEQGCPWDKWTCIDAAAGGHLECLKFAHERGCEWNARTFCVAARGGSMACLEYLYDEGCPWTQDACLGAAEGGHLRVLQWLRERGCPWSSCTVAAARKNRFYDIEEWAIDNGCPVEEGGTVQNCSPLLVPSMEQAIFRLSKPSNRVERIWNGT